MNKPLFSKAKGQHTGEYVVSIDGVVVDDIQGNNWCEAVTNLLNREGLSLVDIDHVVKQHPTQDDYDDYEFEMVKWNRMKKKAKYGLVKDQTNPNRMIPIDDLRPQPPRPKWTAQKRKQNIDTGEVETYFAPDNETFSVELYLGKTDSDGDPVTTIVTLLPIRE